MRAVEPLRDGVSVALRDCEPWTMDELRDCWPWTLAVCFGRGQGVLVMWPQLWSQYSHILADLLGQVGGCEVLLRLRCQRQLQSVVRFKVEEQEKSFIYLFELGRRGNGTDELGELDLSCQR